MNAPSTPLEWVLRAWPQLRGHFRTQSQVMETELLAVFTQMLPTITPGVWPAVRAGLVRSQLLHEAGSGRLSFDPVPVTSPLKPELAPAWLALWHHLQTRLALPLGCLWSTQWLHPFLPNLPDLLVIEVNWAEVSQANRLLEDFSHSLSSDAPASPPCRVVLRPWQRNAPTRRVKGVPVARLEKMLVDAGQLSELAAVVSDATLNPALAALHREHSLNRQLLLQYAADCHTGARWEGLLNEASVG